MEDTQLSYLAGVIDGESTITLLQQRCGDKLPRMSPVVYITNTNLKLLERCSNIIGGVVGHSVNFKVTDQRGNSPVYRIQIAKRADVEKILDAIEPYLVAKQEQLKTVKNFWLIKPYRGIWTEAQAVLRVNICGLNGHKIQDKFSAVTTTKGHLIKMMV